VQGRILSQLTEVPLRGLKVYLVAAAGPDLQRRTASREDGGFEFRSIPAGRYVVVEESELTPYLKWREQSDIDVSGRTVEVRPGQVSPPILIYLPVGAIASDVQDIQLTIKPPPTVVASDRSRPSRCRSNQALFASDN
jgi:hypothetical protein